MQNEHPRRRFLRQILASGAGLGAGSALISPGVKAAGFAEALGYSPKYPADFPAFHYVNPDAPKGGHLALSVFGSFDSLNPFVLKGLAADGLNQLCFETLTARAWDEPFSAYGLLADRADLAEDGRSITFRINDAARFHDGSPVTARDVAFSFDLLVGPQGHPRYRAYWADILKAELPDERHVRFVFRRVNPELHLIIGELPVFSERWVGNRDFATLSREPFLTSGPYRVDQIDYGNTISYRRNPDYWARDLDVRRGQFNFDRVVFKYYKDETVSLEAFKAGEFDVFYETNSKRWARDYTGAAFDDGRIVRREIPHHNNAGMQGFGMNTRRPLFQDRRVRRALDLALDFGWSNTHLFYGQYTRCDSYFSNSELACRGIPTGAELALLAPFRDRLPSELFTQPYQVPVANNPAEQRANLLAARDLLHAAGWTVRDGQLRNEQGDVFRFEIMLAMRGFERIVAPYVYNLKRLGIQVSYRTIDVALYQRRLDHFDFDMTVVAYGESMSPGNELRDRFSSAAAHTDGSSNYMGIDSPVVDALIDRVIYAPDRAGLVTACRALDRVLLWGEYLVPNWYIGAHRMAWWNRFGFHQPLPLYFDALTWVIQTWWQTHEQPQKQT
ncbi:peptide ABC transporter substrate-binding protein [Halothiobacillus diazotrophicus]|uniref:Peptide ABC transporter substrate-binding protein n=1 Tax=Halothiobacillus diazotrophicus TaxID=1860122 RepID=A0A191ZJE2_9GAMM|nr:extracellular solute-binding protein [Halothiobacillus diazotrophicus]ANJ67958.1 peptide ABC transporter substrate-binding protein [Halothiobacillus diazotrophicus]